MVEDEEWRVIPDFEDYEVSNHGNVRRKSTQKLRKIAIGATGQAVIVFTRPGSKKQYMRQVNRLVAEAFLPREDNLPTTIVTHKDHDKTNCHVDNLAWYNKPVRLEEQIDDRSFDDEVWKKIPDFEDYEISNYGRVRSERRPGVIRKNGVNAKGFPVVALYKGPESVRNIKQINRLVAEAFVDVPKKHHPDDPDMDSVWHIDGDLLNCKADNLKWDMRSRVLEWNKMHREKKPQLKMFAFPVWSKRTNKIYPNHFEAAMAEGLTETQITYLLEKFPPSHTHLLDYEYIYPEDREKGIKHEFYLSQLEQ